MPKCFYFLILICISISCKKSDSFNVCLSYIPPTHITKLLISEVLYDTAFIVPDTVFVNEMVDFKFNTLAKSSISSINWDIDNGGYNLSSASFNLRFTNTGNYSVKLIVNYKPYENCDKRVNFADTVKKILHVISEDHNSRIEGNYVGSLDSKPNQLFTINIKYWKYRTDIIGGYYLRNYVNGCLGDGIVWNVVIPNGTGYPILSGYKSFYMSFYPCNQPDNFRGFGFLNNKGDSIIIKHFGYNSSTYILGDTITYWNTFNGKRI